MARLLITPPIKTEGLYKVNSPFQISEDEIYYCAAVRSISELTVKLIDVYSEFYAAAGVSTTEYQADVTAGASIVTLISRSGATIYIPNTYIASYPGFTGTRYDNKVILIKLGLTQAELDISYILDQLASVVTAAVGVTATPEIATVPYDLPLTYEEGSALERARITAIRNNTTIVSENISLAKQVGVLTASNIEYETIINGLLSEIEDLKA